MKWMLLLGLALGAGILGAVMVSTAPAQAPKRKVLIGFVAKSQSNPVFQAAHAGRGTPRRN